MQTAGAQVTIAGAGLHPACWLAQNGAYVPTEHRGREPMPPCDGRLVKAHLIPQQLLKRVWREANHGLAHQRRELPWRGLEYLLRDRRLWVWACGGPAGNGGHHGMLDHSRTLRVPRSALPRELVKVARDDLGIEGWLVEEYL